MYFILYSLQCCFPGCIPRILCCILCAGSLLSLLFLPSIFRKHHACLLAGKSQVTFLDQLMKNQVRYCLASGIPCLKICATTAPLRSQRNIFWSLSTSTFSKDAFSSSSLDSYLLGRNCLLREREKKEGTAEIESDITEH